MKRNRYLLIIGIAFLLTLLSQPGAGAASSYLEFGIGSVVNWKIPNQAVQKNDPLASYNQPNGLSTTIVLAADATCADSDGGQNFIEAGYVEGVGPNDWPFTKNDVCESEDQLREFYCNGTTPWPVFYTCPLGCSDGACVPETCTDVDGDGYAIEGSGCGLVDCNDGDANINPGATEVCDNGIDDDCDGLIDGQDSDCAICTDADGDGYALEGDLCGPIDCDDGNSNVNPGTAEVCDNAIDDDCDAMVDSDDPDCGACFDSDGGLNYEVAGYVEGVGQNGWPQTRDDVCEIGGTFDGYLREFYCNGTTPWPQFYDCPMGCSDGACIPETCTDMDEDGYAIEGGGCGLVDCDDGNANVNPGAAEVCDNGIDDDCNGLVDADDPVCMACTDNDGDGYAVEGGICGLVDCDDGNANVNPGTAEVCDNGIDDDCNGLVDADDPACMACTDNDGDGYAIEGGGCGLVDCDDGNANVNPGAAEACDNAIDDDCNGLVDADDPVCMACTDNDGDGYAVEGGICGLVDCDDGNANVNPGTAEVCDNGIDDDCNGLVDADDPFCSTPKNIIVVGWDGTQLDHFWECYNQELPECADGLPNIQALSGGVNMIFDNITTFGGTATKPGWAQIFTGYNPEITGVFSNGIYQPIPVGFTVFEKVEDHLGDENVVTMFISGKGVQTGGACVGEPTTCIGQPCIEDLGQPWCLTKEHLDYYENDLRQNDNVGNRALELLETHQNDLFVALFLFREPDIIGHLAGENSTNYSESIIDVDRWLGLIMAKLLELGIDNRTIVFVTTDHGFDEGLFRHGNAPYGFFASNDSLIMRSGDRRDIAPTILERYGISLGAIGNAPAVNGHSLYAFPPISCVPEGEAYVDYPGTPACCDDLQVIGLDYQLGSSCVPPTGGTGNSSGYCTACGDGVCTSPENACNCPDDC